MRRWAKNIYTVVILQRAVICVSVNCLDFQTLHTKLMFKTNITGSAFPDARQPTKMFPDTFSIRSYFFQSWYLGKIYYLESSARVFDD